jgi:hypothetical protein
VTRKGDRPAAVGPSDLGNTPIGSFPITIDTLGRTYYRTGKLGTFLATYETTAEYEATSNGDRLWANQAGIILERNA